MSVRFDPLEYNTLVKFLHMTLESWAAIFCVVAIIVIYPARSLDRRSSTSCMLLLLTDCVLNVADVFAWVYCGMDSTFAYYSSRISIFVVNICIYFMVILAALHISAVIITREGKPNKRLMTFTVVLSALGMLIVIVSRFFGWLYTFDEHNLFVRQKGYGLIILLAELAFFPVLIQTIMNRHALRKREYIGFVFSHMVSLIGGVLQFFIEGFSFFNAANSISLIILVMIHQYEYTADVMEWERTRADEQIKLYSRQIKPHFIFNSLSAIRSYIPEDSRARESLNHFSGFLRGSMDLLTAVDCIPAKREFDTVKEYLFMEQDRFGTDLSVVMDIEDEDYLMPPFTVLTIVENAISHGIREKADGRGTVTIRSYTNMKNHVIEVIDDGVGFDVEAYMSMSDADDGSENHIGVHNVKKRLALMCGGTLDMKSTPGEGVTVRVEIPRRKS